MRVGWFPRSKLLSFLQQGRQRGKWWQPCPFLPPFAPEPSVWLPPGSLPGFPSEPSGAEARGRPVGSCGHTLNSPTPKTPERALCPGGCPFSAPAPWLHTCWGFPNLGRKAFRLLLVLLSSEIQPHFLFCLVDSGDPVLTPASHASASNPSPPTGAPKGLPASPWLNRVPFLGPA